MSEKEAPDQDDAAMAPHPAAKCSHETVEKLQFLREVWMGMPLRSPSSEIWIVRCRTCGAQFEDSFVGT